MPAAIAMGCIRRRPSGWGCPAGAVAVALEDLSSAPIDVRMRPVLAYADKLTASARGVTEADARAVLDAGWDATALYHTVAVTALFNFMNRLVEGSGIELDPLYVKPSAERLADRGYGALLKMLGG